MSDQVPVWDLCPRCDGKGRVPHSDIDTIADEEWAAHRHDPVRGFIVAIKCVRARTNAELRQAKDAVDRAKERSPHVDDVGASRD